MPLDRSALTNTLTRLVSRNSEEPNINVAVATTFVELTWIALARKQQRTLTRCRTSAHADGFNDRQIFERSKPAILCRRLSSGIDEIGMRRLRIIPSELMGR